MSGLSSVNGPSEEVRGGAGDQRLVQAAKRGDHRAFEALVVKYQDRIFRLIRRLISGPDAVEDLAQEVFIRAFRSLGDFKGEASFYTWLYKIALNLCRNYYRTRGRRPATEGLDDNDGAVQAQSAGRTPEQEAFRREFWEHLRRGLEELPPEQREAVVLCDLEGMSYEEMADVLGVPIGTVRSRIFRGRRSLQERMGSFRGGRVAEGVRA